MENQIDIREAAFDFGVNQLHKACERQGYIFDMPSRSSPSITLHRNGTITVKLSNSYRTLAINTWTRGQMRLS